MGRLTTFSRLLITLLIVFGVYLAVKNFLPGCNMPGTGSTAGTEQPVSGTSGDNSTAPNSSSSWGKSTAAFTPAAFKYTAPNPVSGKLKGVVELGATGFNYFIVRIDGQKNWKLEKPVFGVSLVKEGLATDDDVKATLKNYIAEILAFGVGARDIHFVVSSGAQKEAIMPKINNALKAMGYVVNVVTPEQEARLSLRAALPPSFQNRAFVVDIGSGNTKISWLPNGALEAPGAKYFQNNISPGAVFEEVKGKASQVPSKLRNTCFIIGGVPYELAKQSRNEKERYTVLKAPADYKPEGEKQKAGLNIYGAVVEATGCKQFVFDWDANFTIGFLLNL
jgi:Ppx/GppA phosphatase family